MWTYLLKETFHCLEMLCRPFFRPDGMSVLLFAPGAERGQGEGQVLRAQPRDLRRLIARYKDLFGACHFGVVCVRMSTARFTVKLDVMYCLSCAAISRAQPCKPLTAAAPRSRIVHWTRFTLQELAVALDCLTC